MATTFDQLRREVFQMGDFSSEFWKKYMHGVPRSEVKDRVEYLKGLCSGKTILHLGCDGYLDQELMTVAQRVYGVDKTIVKDRPYFIACDFDQLAYTPLPEFEGVEMVVCGEILEHLSNPGHFIAAIKKGYPGVPVVFTVPNAFTYHGIRRLVEKGIENVNDDHVCWYSFTTMRTLLRRYGYKIVRFYWYNGDVYTAEGLIFLTK